MRPTPSSIQHLNGNILCAIDCETTGLIQGFHEIWEAAIVPLNRDFELLKQNASGKNIFPFNVMLRPEHPDRIDPEVGRKNVEALQTAFTHGLTQEQAAKALEDWIKTLELPLGKYQGHKRIVPLGQNYPFDLGMIINWLGEDMYEEYFSHLYRDTLRTAIYLDDRAGIHNEKVPYGKYDLSWLANKNQVKTERAHRALDDALATAGIYKAMTQRGFF